MSLVWAEVYAKNVYLSDDEKAAVEVIMRRGLAENFSGAVRLALRELAAAAMILPPLVTPTTPVV